MENTTDMLTWFAWLTTSTGAGWLFSWIAEKIPAWHNVPAEAKKIYSQVGIVAIGLTAYFVMPLLTPDILAWLDPVFKVVVGLLGVNGLVQGYHKLTK